MLRREVTIEDGAGAGGGEKELDWSELSRVDLNSLYQI